MAKTNDLGRFFFYLTPELHGAPLVHRAKTVMTEPPFQASNSVILRLPFGKSLVLGFWRNTGWDEETALMQAVSGWGVDPYTDDLEDPEVRQTIRENIAATAIDLDDEWQIISALGVAK